MLIAHIQYLDLKPSDQVYKYRRRHGVTTYSDTRGYSNSTFFFFHHLLIKLEPIIAFKEWSQVFVPALFLLNIICLLSNWQIRDSLVNSLADVPVESLVALRQTSSTLALVTQESTEVTQEAQVKLVKV